MYGGPLRTWCELILFRLREIFFFFLLFREITSRNNISLSRDYYCLAFKIIYHFGEILTRFHDILSRFHEILSRFRFHSM